MELTRIQHVTSGVFSKHAYTVDAVKHGSWYYTFHPRENGTVRVVCADQTGIYPVTLNDKDAAPYIAFAKANGII